MSWWRAILAVPLRTKLLGANALIVAAALGAHAFAVRAGAGEGQLMAIMVSALAFGFLVDVLLVSIALRPLATLERTAERVWRGDVAARVPLSLLADRDMARVGHTLNLVVDALTDDRLRTRRLAVQIIRQAEADQARVARELHESAAQRLAAQLLLLTAAARNTTDAATRDKLEDIRNMAADTMEELRVLASSMYPHVLDDLGIEAALERLARVARDRYHCPVQTAFDMPEALTPDVSSVIYKIAQEAITAATQYGNATRVRVAVTTGNGLAKIVVHHDGEIRHDDVVTAGAFAVRQRVALAEGQYEVQCTSELGTRVSASIPTAISSLAHE